MIVAIQMIGSYICNHRNVSLKTEHAVQLETRKLYNIHRMRFNSHLRSQTGSDITGQPDVQTRLLQYMMRQ